MISLILGISGASDIKSDITKKVKTYLTDINGYHYGYHDIV